MDCPKCGFECEVRGAECPACGVVFAKFRPNSQRATARVLSEPPSDPSDEPMFESDRFDTLAEKSFDKQPILSMLIGSALALWTLTSPFLYTISNMMKTLVHEFGHTFAGWGFGIPSVPAFDFSYGGGVTIHQDPSLFVLTLIYAALAYLLFLYRHNPRSLALICMIGGAHIALMATGFSEPISIAMGHGFELLFAGIFFYRALSGFACVHEAERPLYGFLGFLITFDNMRFAYRLTHSHEHRWMYENAKGGGHWMDFDRLAREFLLVDLSAIAHFFMLASAAPLIISVALYCTRDRWVAGLGRLVSLRPEA
jgi:hypothetical protein